MSRIASQKLLFRKFCAATRTLTPGPLVVALSGGLDSVVLLHLLSRSVDPHKNPLHPCYIQHGIRSREPEAAALPSFCQSLDLTLRHYRLQPGWLQKQKSGLGLENLARHERYRRLWHCLRELQDMKRDQLSGAIVLAQHADDQTENFLMNLGRGSGPRALAGMPEWQFAKGMPLWRPLLQWQRQDLQRWAETHQLPHWEDHSNFDQASLRNFYRWQVVPQLKRLQPNITQGICRTQEHLQLLGTWLECERQLLETQLQPLVGIGLEWRGDFFSLPDPLQVELIFLLFDRLRHGELRRRRLPLGFVFELRQQLPRRKKLSGHGLQWQLQPDALQVVPNEPASKKIYSKS